MNKKYKTIFLAFIAILILIPVVFIGVKIYHKHEIYTDIKQRYGDSIEDIYVYPSFKLSTTIYDIKYYATATVKSDGILIDIDTDVFCNNYEKVYWINWMNEQTNEIIRSNNFKDFNCSKIILDGPWSDLMPIDYDGKYSDYMDKVDSEVIIVIKSLLPHTSYSDDEILDLLLKLKESELIFDETCIYFSDSYYLSVNYDDIPVRGIEFNFKDFIKKSYMH